MKTDGAILGKTMEGQSIYLHQSRRLSRFLGDKFGIKNGYTNYNGWEYSLWSLSADHNLQLEITYSTGWAEPRFKVIRFNQENIIKLKTDSLREIVDYLNSIKTK
jgi:hypothetical protein